MSTPLLLAGQPLSLEEISQVALGNRAVALDPAALPRIRSSRAVVDGVLARGETAYGVNTGFGKLSEVRIEPGEVRTLQRNLVRSHACGLGEPLPDADVRAMLLLRANVLAKGYSGVRPELIETLLALLNWRIHPVIPARGSVGASGDLAPLAHLALALIGEGQVLFEGRPLPAAMALLQAGIAPLVLEAKEGLALLNGTQAITAVGALALARALRVVELSDLAGAMTLEALKGTPTPFDERIHAVRPHAGQVAVAAHLRALLAESEIRESHRHNDPRVQDAYCLRCMPQVHGAVRDALGHARATFEIESGAATDNPLVFAEGEILSGGNFHGAPLALAARRSRDRDDDADGDWRAARGSAGQSRHQRRVAAVSFADAGGVVGIHDRARGCGGAAQRGEGARASGERGQRPDIGWQRGSRFDGDDGGTEVSAGRREC
jgi:histidine ammonia-lyase